jgi:uncharacterized protein (TIGR03435 family)
MLGDNVGVTYAIALLAARIGCNLLRGSQYSGLMPRSIMAVAGASILATMIWGQSAPKTLRFDVAAIRPSDPATPGARMNIGPGGTLTVVNQPLRKLITYAYDLRNFQLVGGPGWVDTDRYDISAKAPVDDAAGSRDAGGREKVRSLLSDRFGLVLHRETKMQNVYRMVVAKRGARMRAVETFGKQRGIYGGQPGHIQGFAATTDMLARELAGITGRVVIDNTNLTGMYDWTLQWTTETADDATAGPTIFTALQEQLGLKLEPAKAPVDVVVIDHVSRPTVN